jgi:hypothetical protein
MRFLIFKFPTDEFQNKADIALWEVTGLLMLVFSESKCLQRKQGLFSMCEILDVKIFQGL